MSVGDLKLENQAKMVARDIVNLMQQYTHDSPRPKFYLPTEISKSIMIMAGAFASIAYKPLADIDAIYETEIFGILYLSVTYGFQVYLKEYSLKNDSAPFSYITDKKEINTIRAQTFKKAELKSLEASSLAEKVFEIYTNNLKKTYIESEFQIEGYVFREKKFFELIQFSLLWGYNFGKGIIRQGKGVSGEG